MLCGAKPPILFRFSLLCFIWKKSLEILEKREERGEKRTKRKSRLHDFFFLAIGYEKDIFAIFAYEFELSH